MPGLHEAGDKANREAGGGPHWSEQEVIALAAGRPPLEGTEPGGTELEGTEPGGTEPEGTEPGGTERQLLEEGYVAAAALPKGSAWEELALGEAALQEVSALGVAELQLGAGSSQIGRQSAHQLAVPNL